MTLLGLLRHAHAGDPARWTGPDASRPLSEKGRRQAERLGGHLRRIGDAPGLVISSPRLRALQTAEIVAEALAVGVSIDARLGDALELDTLEAILVDAGNPERPLLVGHDPDFSELLGMLVGAGPIPMRKGAYARVEVERPLAVGRGTLRLLLPPDALPEE